MSGAETGTDPGAESAGPGRVVLCLPLDDEERLAAEAARRGISIVARCSGAAELTTRIPTLRPDLVVTVAQPQYLDARLLAECDAHGVRLLVGAGTREEHRHARLLGITRTVPIPVQWPEHESALLPVDVADGPGPAARPRRRGGRVTAVWGPAGAPGRSSLAIAVAAELARAGERTALADADTHAAAIAPALGLLDEAPGFAAACRLAGIGSLTREELDRVSEWVPSAGSGFRVLTGIGRPNRWPELTPERVEGVIDAARDWVDHLVLDTAASIERDDEIMSDLASPRRNGAALAALATADQVLLVGAADAIGLARLLRAHAELVEEIPAERITVVINKVRSSAVGIAPESQLRQSLARFGGIQEPVLIPWDPGACDAALLAAQPLPDAAPRSAAVAAIRRLVLDRLATEASRPRRRLRAPRRRARRASAPT